MNINQKIITKLKLAIDNSGLTIREIASKSGIHEVSLHRFLNGSRKLNNIDVLIKISKTLGVNMSYFLESNIEASNNNFSNEISIVYGEYSDISTEYDSHIKIPIMRCKVGASPTIIELSDDTIDSWICIESKNVPKNISARCFAFRVKGDSMEPFLCEGDLVAILPYDESPTLDEIKHTNIYLAKIPDGFGGYGLSIKHISVIDNYKIDLVSENKKYDNLRIDLSETPDFKILGRVIWMWREF